MSVRLTYENLAKDPMAREAVMKELAPLLMRVRDNRKGLERRWERYYKMWNGEFDAGTAGYTGRNKIFLAATRRVIESWVSSMSAQFHNQDDWWKIRPVQDVTDQLRADTLSALEAHFIKKLMNVKSKNKRHFRQLCLYGTSVVKLAWRDEEQIVTSRKLDLTDPANPTSTLQHKPVKLYYGPTYRVLDLFNFFVYPETVDDPEEAELVFEDMLVTTDHIRAQSEKLMDPRNPDLGHVYEVDSELFRENSGSSVPNSEFFKSRQERLSRMGIANDPSQRWLGLGDNLRNLTEIYWKTDLDGTGVKSWLLTFVNDFYCIRIQENPFWRKTTPYLSSRLISLVNEFYGRGIPESIERVQVMMNQIANQTVDSVQFELNPITVIDPGRVAFAQSIRLQPGMKWLADPEGIKFTTPPRVADVGLSALQAIQGWMHDYSGANAMVQGVPAVRGRGRIQSTASGANQLLQQGQAPISDTVEDLEDTLGKPLLRKVYELIEQFMDVPVMLRILGKSGATLIQRRVSVEDVVGDYEFEWLGVTGARNKLVLGQQMINFLNVARGLPPEVLQNINWKWLAERIWVDGLGLKDSEQLFNPNGLVPSIDPRVELLIMKENRDVEVSPSENKMAHITQHLRDRENVKDQELLARLDAHITATMQAIMAEAQAKKQAQEMQAMAMAQQAAQGQNGKSQGARPQQQPSGFAPSGTAALAQQLQGGGIQ